MALTLFDKDMQIIAKLDDEPNDVGGLTAAELKDKFDEAGLFLKEYINGTLLPELIASSAAEALGAFDRDGGTSTVQAELHKLVDEIKNVVLGSSRTAYSTAGTS